MPEQLGDILHFPMWSQPTTLDKLEGRIDSALTSANPILNAILSPVRSFVHDVLHPVLSFGDFIITLAWNGVRWVFDRGSEAIWNTAHAINWAIDRAGDFAASIVNAARADIGRLIDIARTDAYRWVGDVRSFAASIVNDTRSYVSALFANLEGWARTAIDDTRRWSSAAFDDARSFATRVGVDAASFARAAADTVAHDLRVAIDAAARVALRAVDDLRQWTTDALHLIEQGGGDVASFIARDLIAPVAHRLDSFIDNEWHYAQGLLKLIEDAAGWIGWVSRRAVPDIIEGYQTVKGWAAHDIDGLVAHATRSHNSAA